MATSMGDCIEIEVVNFKAFNPRSDRKSHSWFRLQNDIATEPKFHGLTCGQRFIAVCLFAEASKVHVKRDDGTATIHISWLCKQLGVKAAEVLKTIRVLVDVGVVRLPHGNQAVSPGTTTNDTNDTNERTNDTVPAASTGVAQLPPLAVIWNEHSGALGKVRECKATRLKHHNVRWDEHPDPAHWVPIIQRIARSPFCCGENDRKWRADFDWLLKPETAGKVLEGKYDPRSGAVVRSIDPERKKQIDEHEAEMARALKQIEVKL